MDKTVEKICKQISDETGVELPKVRNAVKHCFNWTRINLMELNYAAILLNKLGTFSVMEKRADNYKDVVRDYKNKKNGKEEDGGTEPSGRS